MDSIRRNVRQTCLRLAVNGWFEALGWCFVGAAVLWVVAVVADKLLVLDWPLGLVAVGLAVSSMTAAAVWAVLKH